jgi:hypothetical protein
MVETLSLSSPAHDTAPRETREGLVERGEGSSPVWPAASLICARTRTGLLVKARQHEAFAGQKQNHTFHARSPHRSAAGRWNLMRATVTSGGTHVNRPSANHTPRQPQQRSWPNGERRPLSQHYGTQRHPTSCGCIAHVPRTCRHVAMVPCIHDAARCLANMPCRRAAFGCVCSSLTTTRTCLHANNQCSAPVYMQNYPHPNASPTI